MPEPVEPYPLEDDWLDDQFLSDDESERYWARRALNGMTPNEALSAVPRNLPMCAQLSTHIWRELKVYFDGLSMTRSRWLRRAIGRELLRDGYDPRKVREWFGDDLAAD